MTESGGSALSLLGARISTARALGLGNIARVLSYKLRLRAGIHPVQRLAPGATLPGPFFHPPGAVRALPAPEAWQESARYFGWYRPALEQGPPDWHRNPFDGRRPLRTEADWWTIPDFDPAAGDIKAIWEASRFDWVVHFAQQGAAGRSGAIDRLNAWLADWWAKNPPYRGHNWKCGQESSIRVMHLALGALILADTEAPRPDLVDLLLAHLRRIGPTLAYATGQDNNHGISEAVALFIGGSWLERLRRGEGPRWQQQGRSLLENRVRRLIEPDGSFSQYSVNYHRLMLDALSLAEVWRRTLELPGFSARFASRASAASTWLRAVVDPVSGDAPNYGANDGANLLPLTDADYRDFRPTVQLASALFEGGAAFPAGPWLAQLQWLGVLPGSAPGPQPDLVTLDDGGLAILARGRARAVLRYPRFRFRPSHADALHLDLWVAGENLLRDGGSFSYAAEPEWQDYFAGAGGHNSVAFDGHEQMPRLGRFLWGRWLSTESLEPAAAIQGGCTAGASYRDAWGATHARRVMLTAVELTVTDRVAGFATRAVLRWRLWPGEWTADGTVVSMGRYRLEVMADVPIVRFALVAGWESRYYLQKTPVPVLEVEVASSGTLTSRCRWGE